MSNLTNTIKLNSGYEIPQLGFGVYLIWDYEECKAAVLKAFKAGYRHIDTAQLYKNEHAVGDAIRESGIPRDEVFITTKIWTTNYGYEKAKAAIDKSLGKLKTDYIDLMLLHQRFEDYKGAWKALEEGVSEGKIRSIGVSNFRMDQVDEIISSGRIVPAVNQVECHPYFQQNEMRKYLAGKDIQMEAWYPLGHGDKKLLSESLFTELAGKYHKSVVQVILRWHVQMRNIVFPKSLSESHIRDNADIFDFELSMEDMNRIASIDKNKSYFNRPDWLDRWMCKMSDKVPFGEKDY